MYTGDTIIQLVFYILPHVWWTLIEQNLWFCFQNHIHSCHDTAGLTLIAANMENMEDTELGAKKRLTKWARDAKLTAIEIFCKWSCCTPRWAVSYCSYMWIGS